MYENLVSQEYKYVHSNGLEGEVMIQDQQNVCATYQYKLKKCQAEMQQFE